MLAKWSIGIRWNPLAGGADDAGDPNNVSVKKPSVSNSKYADIPHALRPASIGAT